jgi:hypothetical protein
MGRKPKPKVKVEKEKTQREGNTAWCFSCKMRVEIADAVQDVTKRGGAIVRGKCVNCQGRVSVLGPLYSKCPGCDEVKRVPKDDYICGDCRG